MKWNFLYNIYNEDLFFCLKALCFQNKVVSLQQKMIAI